MKTAIEWLEEQLINNKELISLEFEQAKEMEKEQIMDAYNHGKFNSVTMGTSEQYYNETFKSE